MDTQNLEEKAAERLKKIEKYRKDIKHTSLILKNTIISMNNYEKTIQNCNPQIKNLLLSNYICMLTHTFNASAKTFLSIGYIDYTDDTIIEQSLKECESDMDIVAKYFTDKFDDLFKSSVAQIDTMLYHPDSNFGKDIMKTGADNLDDYNNN